MATTAKKTAPTAAKKTAPKVEKKVAPQVEAKTEETSVFDNAVTAVSDAVNKVTDNVSDGAKSSVDTVKESLTDAETAISEARVTGNSKAKKVLSDITNDKANSNVATFVGFMGEITFVCVTVGCAPMLLSANAVNNAYKKLTA